MGSQFYIVCYQVSAEQSNDGSYRVTYPDGSIKTVSKQSFEGTALGMGADNGSRVTQQMVDDFVRKTEVSTIGKKTTLVTATLKNGFEISETSACADPANYREDIGEEHATDRIKQKIWALLGFLLQSAMKGTEGF